MSVSILHPDVFIRRHIGPSSAELPAMLEAIGVDSLDTLIDQTIPAAIRRSSPLALPGPVSEQEALAELDALGGKNQVFRTYLGMGYTDCVTPPVILRNVLENPGWYTQYTPYQAEIAQGRLEALLNFQTLIIDMTGLEVANASLLDDATAAAEAMHMMAGITGTATRNTLLVDEDTHPQIIGVIQTRAQAIGIDVRVEAVGPGAVTSDVYGLILSYPKSSGQAEGWEAVIAEAHAGGALVTLVADLLSLAVLKSPGALGADIAVGSAQRFGVPMGYGGPYAAFMATRSEHVRKMPGRIIGVSEDSAGRPALRMALATREQHIRREKATSNICTAQALLAITASMYAVYHGPEGIRGIAEKVHGLAVVLAEALRQAGLSLRNTHFFDTVCVEGSLQQQAAWVEAATQRRINLRCFSSGAVSMTLDEATRAEDVADLVALFTGQRVDVPALAAQVSSPIPAELRRTTPYLTHPVFNSYHSETDMLRYMRMLELRDLSLAHAMIPLGSCTMKLNATAEMVAITRPAWAKLHPFAPKEQAQGYAQLFADLEAWLSEVTGFPGISLQPNAGSQGEYAGLLVIRAWQAARGEGHRDVCLIPSSAHGTNPASAVMAGLKVVVVACDADGNIDLKDLEAKARQHAEKLAALMVTYPSTHGVFEEEIKAICQLIHTYGGQVYMDGANMNAQVGLTRPGDIGADVCHLNLHKTFCIPHGGGGPGMGPIGVAAHLKDFLPNHPVVDLGHAHGIGPVSSAPWGSASILPISWAYIRMMGAAGLTEATRYAILNANYIASRLDPFFKVLYRGGHGRVAHECILDMRSFKKTASIEVDDIAKRLMDFGFHAPTMSFPIPSTMMVEPTESESKAELDRLIDALVAIRDEIAAIEAEAQPREGNVLKNAPHTADAVTSNEWEHPYSRKQAAFPAPWVRTHKFWPAVGRVNNALGDRKLICSCPPLEAYAT